MHDADDLLTTREAAALIHVSPRTLEGWRLRGGGPAFLRVGKRLVRYAAGDVLTWAKRQRLFSTSEIDVARPKAVAAPSVRLARRSKKAS